MKEKKKKTRRGTLRKDPKSGERRLHPIDGEGGEEG